MKLLTAAVFSCFVLALAAAPTWAAEEKKNEKTSDSETVVAAPQDKPERSVTNPNDGKDANPNDGDAGKGNDNRPPRP